MMIWAESFMTADAAYADVSPTEKVEPNIGIKFIIKAKNPQTTGKSSPIKSVSKNTRIPVASEIKNFIEM